MTFEELQEIGASMSAEELTESLHSLTKDRRFAALVQMLRNWKETTADQASAPKYAGNHGLLAHAAGARSACTELEAHIRAACVAPAKRKGRNPPPPPEE